MSVPEYAVEVRQVTKRFKRRTVKGGHTTLKTQLVGLFTGKKRERFEQQDIEVLRGVDLLIPKGRTVGIIGQNGSGKSTLLKLLTGIYTPTHGTAVIHGRVSALLELGAGFHPDFSGRENIFINGVILGLSRTEIRARIDEIIAFSELGDFIDEPVRTYSSGMYMRLAFAVATFVDPDVLIIDEILSVGDEHFTRKSRAKMEEFKHSGKTIVLVTHDLGTVERWCDMAVWIDAGKIAECGEPRRVVAAYRQRVAERELASEIVSQTAAVVAAPVEGAPAAAVPVDESRWGSGHVHLQAVRLLDYSGTPIGVVEPESSVCVEIDFKAAEGISDAAFGIGIFRADGLHIYGSNTRIDRVDLPTPLPAAGTVRFTIDRIGLLEGNYTLDAAAAPENGADYDYWKKAVVFAVRTEAKDVGLMRPPHRWEFGVPLRSTAGRQVRA